MQILVHHVSGSFRTRRFSECICRPSGTTKPWKNTMSRDSFTFGKKERLGRRIMQRWDNFLQTQACEGKSDCKKIAQQIHVSKTRFGKKTLRNMARFKCNFFSGSKNFDQRSYHDAPSGRILLKTILDPGDAHCRAEGKRSEPIEIGLHETATRSRTLRWGMLYFSCFRLFQGGGRKRRNYVTSRWCRVTHVEFLFLRAYHIFNGWNFGTPVPELDFHVKLKEHPVPVYNF